MSQTITIRFTAQTTNLLYVGLRLITLHHIVLNKTGRSPAAHPDLLTLRFRNRRGKFFPEYMEGVYGLWKQVSDHRAREWRLRVGYIEIMVCMLAVRTTIRQIRHGHILSWRHGIEQTAARQLRRLEALRKRLKRLITKTKGQHFFRELAAKWREFLKWLRLNILFCNCLIRRPDPAYRSRQRLIDSMCRVTRTELLKRRTQIPNEQIYRKLIRDALKNVRRFRTPWTAPLLLRNPHIGADWFADYIIRRASSIRS
jgi:hypothetical protein